MTVILAAIMLSVMVGVVIVICFKYPRQAILIVMIFAAYITLVRLKHIDCALSGHPTCDIFER